MSEMKLSNNILLNHSYDDLPCTYLHIFTFQKLKKKKYQPWTNLSKHPPNLTPLDSDKELSDNSSKTSHLPTLL